MGFKLNLFTQQQVQNTYGCSVPSFRAANTAAFSFGSEPIQDKFSTNPMYASLGTKKEIEALAKSNPKIMELLNKYNLPLKVNMEALEDMV